MLTRMKKDRLAAQLAVLVGLVAAPALGDEPGLAVLMERMQTYTHKLQLSIEARNGPLAHFYLHELEETGEFVARHIEHYDDYPVGRLLAEMLLPQVERLEELVDAGQWPASEAGFTDLVRACNACHLVTAHGFIRIAPAGENPFAQDFSVADD
jgi:hypothetical protein